MFTTYQMSSRLGLLHLPQGQTELNIGVEDGPSAVLSPEFAQSLGLNVKQFLYSSPDQIDPEQYYTMFAEEARKATELIISQMNEDSSTEPTSVVVGGDHSVALAHVSAVLQTVAQPASTAIVMIDSHADLNLRSTSPTGNIHGMWMRPIVDHFDVAALDQLVLNKVPAQNLFYIGNLDLDPAEEAFIAQHQVGHYSAKYLRAEPKTTQHSLSEWCQHFSHIHLSIDIDAFDQTVAPATGIPCKNGLFLEDVSEFFSIIRHSPAQWSLDLVEVNPQKPGAAETVAYAQKILTTLLKN